MKKLLCILLTVLLILPVLASCDDDIKYTPTANTFVPNHVAPLYSEIDRSAIDSLDGVEVTSEQTDYVLIEIADYGKILIRLYPDVAPLTVANFKKLVSQGFYDGLIFHRVIDNFMIQGGDPDGNGTGGSDEEILGEFSSNGFVNNLKHKRGVVSMARSDAPNSASSQFFICHKTSQVEHLDGSYAAFGFVVYGMDVVDDIADVKTNSSDKPIKDVVITSIKFVTVPEQSAKSDSSESSSDTSADTSSDTSADTSNSASTDSYTKDY